MRHIPVLLEETIKVLQPSKNESVIDVTIGDGGHAASLLQLTGPKGKLLGIDTDKEGLIRAKKFLGAFGNRVTFAPGNFLEVDEIAEENGFEHVDIILADLGWSTPQFEMRGRGFSFQKDEPLDMRLGGSDQLKLGWGGYATASEIINEATKKELEEIFDIFGEERFSAHIAKKIVEARKEKKIKTTKQLILVIKDAYSTKPRPKNIHPATKVFQALRIAVNNELQVLKESLPLMVDLLAPGGRLAVITFHSLEDRIVKHYFKKRSYKDIKILTKKPLTASEEELAHNPRARSAKLRAIQKQK